LAEGHLFGRSVSRLGVDHGSSGLDASRLSSDSTLQHTILGFR
jgi:hypothetical protein